MPSSSEAPQRYNQSAARGGRARKIKPVHPQKNSKSRYGTTEGVKLWLLALSEGRLRGHHYIKNVAPSMGREKKNKEVHSREKGFGKKRASGNKSFGTRVYPFALGRGRALEVSRNTGKGRIQRLAPRLPGTRQTKKRGRTQEKVLEYAKCCSCLPSHILKGTVVFLGFGGLQKGAKRHCETAERGEKTLETESKTPHTCRLCIVRKRRAPCHCGHEAKDKQQSRAAPTGGRTVKKRSQTISSSTTIMKEIYCGRAAGGKEAHGASSRDEGGYFEKPKGVSCNGS